MNSCDNDLKGSLKPGAFRFPINQAGLYLVLRELDFKKTRTEILPEQHDTYGQFSDDVMKLSLLNHPSRLAHNLFNLLGETVIDALGTRDMKGGDLKFFFGLAPNPTHLPHLPFF